MDWLTWLMTRCCSMRSASAAKRRAFSTATAAWAAKAMATPTRVGV